jgi:hypothetical protein
MNGPRNTGPAYTGKHRRDGEPGPVPWGGRAVPSGRPIADGRAVPSGRPIADGRAVPAGAPMPGTWPESGFRPEAGPRADAG